MTSLLVHEFEAVSVDELPLYRSSPPLLRQLSLQELIISPCQLHFVALPHRLLVLECQIILIASLHASFLGFLIHNLTQGGRLNLHPRPTPQILLHFILMFHGVAGHFVHDGVISTMIILQPHLLFLRNGVDILHFSVQFFQFCHLVV